MKVRILNGAHTSLVFPSMLCGAETVGESLKDNLLNGFLNTCLFEYILPTLGDTEENRQFAAAVLERFANPYIKHMWQSISLNSVSKFTARVLPTVSDYTEKNHAIPKPLVFSLACLTDYYTTNDVQDDLEAVAFIKEHSVFEILANAHLWGQDLSSFADIPAETVTAGYAEAVNAVKEQINSIGNSRYLDGRFAEIAESISLQKGETVLRGSGFGYLNEMLGDQSPRQLVFFENEDVKSWISLLNGAELGADLSFAYGERTEKLLLQNQTVCNWKGCFAGHDHMNNFSVNYNGIRLTYGLSCDHNIYVVPFRGGTLINIKNDGSFTTQSLIRHRGQSTVTVCKEK